MRKRFTLDKSNGKLLGVCAGLARYTGWDATLIRAATVVAAFFVHPLVIVYFAAAWLVPSEGRARDEDEAPRPTRLSTYDMKRTPDDFDRRMAEVDHCMASAESPLAREIEALRR